MRRHSGVPKKGFILAGLIEDGIDGGVPHEWSRSWEQPLLSPADGTVVVARDELEDSDGVNFVTDPADAAGNVIVIELDTGYFVVLAHLRHGTLRVSEGDRVPEG